MADSCQRYERKTSLLIKQFRLIFTQQRSPLAPTLIQRVRALHLPDRLTAYLLFIRMTLIRIYRSLLAQDI